MTYGEAHRAELDSMELVNGEFVKTVYIADKPKPMCRKDAVAHYNTKLFAYWMDQLDDRLSILRKKQIIAALMFGHVDKHKLFEENKNEIQTEF